MFNDDRPDHMGADLTFQIETSNGRRTYVVLAISPSRPVSPDPNDKPAATSLSPMSWVASHRAHAVTTSVQRSDQTLLVRTSPSTSCSQTKLSD